MPQYYEIELLSAKKVIYTMSISSSVCLMEWKSFPEALKWNTRPVTGSGYMSTAQQPVNTFANWYQLNISEQDPLLSSDTDEGVSILEGKPLKLRFQVNTECGFTSGRRIRFFSWAYNA
ncbi:MAG: hypothetical protein R2787_04625 [Saprospiraceae bacterium]